MGGVHVVFAVGTHQQQAVDVFLAQHEVDEAERHPPGPLQVVDEHHHRSFARRDRPQHVQARALRAHLGGERVARVGRHRQQRRHLRRCRGQQARIHTDRPEDPLADLGQLVLRLGQQQPAQCAKRLMSSVELQIPPILVELAGHEPAVPARHHRPQLVDQSRLTHPGCPADQHPATPPGQRLPERRFEGHRLVLASHQPRRRQEPQRNIVFADAEPRWCPAHPLQVVKHAIGRLVAIVRFLVQQMHDDLGQRRRHDGVHLRRRHRHPSQMIMGEAQRVAGTERRLARRQLVQRRAERVQVGTLIDRPCGAPGLLRRQVRQCPHDLGVVRELRADLGQRRRQREVNQARGAVRGEHDVRRRDVPVHHPPAVHPGNRPSQVQREPDQVVDGHGQHLPGQARVARVHQQDRPRVPRRLQHLRDAGDTAQPLQDRQLVPQPAVRVRSQRFLADGRAPRQVQPGHPRALALVQRFVPNPRIPARQQATCPHPTVLTPLGGPKRQGALSARS
jgi:hypothetical protein